MAQGRLERLAPLAGVLFTVVFAVGFLTAGETPDTKASGEEVISHYADGGKIFVGIFALLIGAVLFLFFAGVLRGALASSARAPEWLATVVFGGAVIYAAALAIPAVLGLATILLATGWHTMRSAVLPTWLAWVSIVLGLLSMAGPAGFISFLLFPIWVLAVAVVLYRAGAPTLVGSPDVVGSPAI
ncbi:MAG: hypothetical protein ACR2HM_06040 [Acidimicrobiales bacterium]